MAKKNLKSGQKNMIKKADIKLGFLCNNNCLFCAQGEEKKKYGNLSTEEIKKLLKISRKNCQMVVLTGGEPTIRKDIIELVSFAKNLKFSVIQIQSNGRMLAYKDFCQKIIKAGANEFSIALHGHIAQLHEYLTNSKGSFKQTCLGIKNLKSLGQNVLTNTVVVKPNYRHLVEITKLLIVLKVDQFQFSFVHPIRSAAKNFDNIVPRISLVIPYLKKAIALGEYFKKRVTTEAIPHCFLENKQHCISESFMPKMTVFDAGQTILDFSNVRINDEKAKGPECPKCKYFKICEGTWKEYPQVFGWKEFKPILN